MSTPLPADERRGFEHGLRNLSVTYPTTQERSLAWWRGRRRGSEAREALERVVRAREDAGEGAA